ncbi:MAG TPA: hypothetical protein VEF04_18490, partial [Blastocatellia bacterium]|nr:hypothetical protein [Blastocatellia bacterium]
MQLFYFIVTFEVAEGKEQEFRREFDEIANDLQQASGGRGVSATLYEVSSEVEEHLLQVPGISSALQGRPNSRASFRFVIIAEWESVAHYEASIRARQQNKRISFPANPGYYRVAAEYLGANNTISQPEQGFTFINPFEIPEGEEAEFIKQWHMTIQHLNTASGFVSARLYEVDLEVEAQLLKVPGLAEVLQRRPNGKARFPFIWVSEWASVAQYADAVRAFGRGKPISFTSHP